ncbi:MAG: CTP synthase, partial [Firmicutes bacterium]|nr:CTP synthase [Bacillota bacterium]
HVTLVPYLSAVGEAKTKPTQHSVKELRSIGIQPDAIVCRTQRPLSRDMRDKIALLCDVDRRAVIQNVDSDSIYRVPLMLHEDGLDEIVLNRLGLSAGEADLDSWSRIAEELAHPEAETTIAVVGKYVALHDAYLSVAEALSHGAIAHRARVNIRWVNSEDIEAEGAAARLDGVDGVLVPGGFGYRGVEGKVEAIRWAREERVPFFGICMGMQAAVIEAARHQLGLTEANSTEFVPDTPDPVIDLMADQKDIDNLGGTMRLGSYPCEIRPGSVAGEVYRRPLVFERHRHRFEVNNRYRDRLAQVGLEASGLSPDGRLVEIMERRDHPWFVGTQFHPEFQSRPNRPHPLFTGFVGAALAQRRGSQAVQYIMEERG